MVNSFDIPTIFLDRSLFTINKEWRQYCTFTQYYVIEK